MKNVNLENDSGIETHDLQNKSILPLPLDQGSRPNFSVFYQEFVHLIYVKHPMDGKGYLPRGFVVVVFDVVYHSAQLPPKAMKQQRHLVRLTDYCLLPVHVQVSRQTLHMIRKMIEPLDCG